MPVSEDVIWGAGVLAFRVLVIAILYFFLLRAFNTLRLEFRRPAARAVAGNGHRPGWLEIVEWEGAPGQIGRRYPLAAVTTIGRDPDSSVALPDARVSARHARLILQGGEWWLEDLGATNGTFMNGHPVSAVTRVDRGAELRLGPVTLRLDEDGGA